MSFRAVGSGLFLFWIFSGNERSAPSEWIFPFVGDFFIGTTALFLVYYIIKKPSTILWVLLLSWNVVGLLDLIGAYLPHLVQHKVKLLWHIHIVHHTDHKVDTTTANRHHPLESVVRFIFTFIAPIKSNNPITFQDSKRPHSIVLGFFIM